MRIYSKQDNIATIYNCDVFEHGDLIPDGSVDCIITDPPYPKKYLHYWKYLGYLGMKWLKPSGYIVTYAPQLYLDHVVEGIKYYGMRYWWQMAMTHRKFKSTVFPRRAICGYKPILVFQKEPVTKPYKSFVDLVEGSGREKSLHPWQQSERELFGLIEIFTQTGDTIADPFLGSGTTIAAAVRCNRVGKGFEIDDGIFDKAARRIDEI